MSNKRYPLFTQGLNECSLYTILNIWRMTYGIILNEKEREKMIQQAKSDGVWDEKTGAKFSLIYNWATGYFKNKYGVDIEVIERSILSDDFDTLTRQGTAWGLGLLYAGGWYKRVREDKKITLEEIENSDIDNEKYYGHNMVWKLGRVVGILKSIPYDDKIIEFSSKALKKAVEKGFFRATARSFRIKDELLHYYLFELNKGTKFNNVELLDDKNRKALDLALKLRIVKK